MKLSKKKMEPAPAPITQERQLKERRAAEIRAKAFSKIMEVSKPVPDCEPYRYIGSESDGFYLLFEDGFYARTYDGQPVKYPTLEHLQISASQFIINRNT